MKQAIYCLLQCLFPLFLTAQTAQWQPAPAPDGGGGKAICRVGDALWLGTPVGVFSSADDGASWSRLTAFPAGWYVWDIVARSGSEVFVLTALPDEARIFILKKTAGSWSVADQIPLDDAFIGYPGTTEHLFLTQNAVLAFSEFTLSFVGIDLKTKQQYFKVFADEVSVQGERATYFFNGQIHLSHDAGKNWASVWSNPNFLMQVLLDYPNLYAVSSNQQNFVRHDLTTGQTTTHLLPIPAVGDDKRLWKSGDTLFLANPSERFFSTNQGQNWQLHARWSGFGSFAVEDEVVEGGKQFLAGKNFVRSLDGGATFEVVENGIQAAAVAHLASTDNVLFCDVQAGDFHLRRSFDGGKTWEKTPGAPPGNIYSMVGLGKTLFVSVGTDLYFSTDWGDTFEAVSNATPCGTQTLYRAGKRLIASHFPKATLVVCNEQGQMVDVVAAPKTLNTSGVSWDRRHFFEKNGTWFYVAEQSNLHVSNDLGKTWTLRTTIPIANFWALGQAGSNLLCAGTKSVMYSTNEGQTWLPANVPSGISQVHGTVQFFNFGADVFLIKGSTGVFVSHDKGVNWLDANANLPTKESLTMAAWEGVLKVGTPNAGVWDYTATLPQTTFSGLIFNDLNKNGQRDAGENPVPDMILQASSSGLVAGTGNDFRYRFPLAAVQGDTLRVMLPDKNWAVSPAFRVVGGQASGGNDFGVYRLQALRDLSVKMTNNGTFRPNFISDFTIFVKNEGSVELPSTRLKLLIPKTFTVSFVYPFDYATSGDTLVFDLGKMAPGERIVQTLRLWLKSNAPIGSTLTFRAWVTPLAGDDQPADNLEVLNATVASAFNPNTKHVAPQFIGYQQIRERPRLEYTIRFQNPGAERVHFVRLTDTLDTWLDPATFRFVGSNLPFNWKISGQGVVEFFLEEFELTEWTPIEDSQGFVRFSVQPKQNLPPGTKIENTADLVFDTNPRLRTNTVATNFGLFLPGIVPSGGFSGLGMSFRPNPAAAVVRISWAEATPASGQLTLTNAGGTVVLTQNVAAGSREVELQLSGLPVGNYLATLSAGNFLTTGKLAVAR